MARPRLGAAVLTPRRIVVTLLMAVGLVVMLPVSQASAHAFLTDSNPSDGAVLTAPPTTLRLQFSESVVIAATRIDITDSSGRHYLPTAQRLVHTASGASTEEPAQVVADLPTLPDSAYRVSWQTLSSDDLHRTSGLLVFGVNEPVKASAFAEPAPRPEEAALRWVLFASLAMALGGQLAGRLYRRNGCDQPAADRSLRLSTLGATAGALTAVGLLVDQLRSSGSPVAHLLLSSYGARWSLRECGFGVLLAAALLSRRFARPQAVRASLVVVGAASACLGSAWLGHAGSGAGFAPTRALADAAHLAAAGTWSGTLLVILCVVLPRLRSGDRPGAAARAVLRGFGVPAAACVSVMIVTGLYLASGVVGSVDAALFTFYGRTLLVKLGIVGVVSILGLVNTRRLHGRGSRTTPRRTVIAEGLLAVTILALAAVLTSGQPAREPEFVAAHNAATVPIVDSTVADLQESLAVRPNQPGRNVVLVQVFDTRRPAPATIRRVLVSFVGLDGRTSTPVAAERLADGQWSVATNLATSGRTHVRIAV
ncbi:MAG: Copper resistance protein, partial [Pseudonocardiales bacterium]|nr:Copper resistance protein [Pseudonocardiales bacterium]